MKLILQFGTSYLRIGLKPPFIERVRTGSFGINVTLDRKGQY